jgi:hypothetical protein
VPKAPTPTTAQEVDASMEDNPWTAEVKRSVDWTIKLERGRSMIAIEP